MIGRILGNRYEIIEKIGGGGMAYVYKAKCRLLNRPVAIKILRTEFVSDEDFVRRFRREAQAAASLSHPNIVSIYDVGQEDNIHYIVMEYLDGMTLKELIQKEGKLSPKETVNIAVQICEALHHAHQNHIIHRDIKPHNILINNDGRIKVTDFGIARAVSSQTVTHTGSVMGSVQYFSPEQAKGGYVGIKSDLYSLGIVMYEMVTGKVPFDGESPISIALKHIQNQPIPPKDINKDIPKSLNDVILKSITKDESLRFENALEMMADIKKSLLVPEGWYTKRDFDLEKTRVVKTFKNGGENKPVGENTRTIKPKKQMKWLIPVIIILITFIISYWGYTLLMNFLNVPEVDVPEVVGLSEDQAREIFREHGLSYDVEDRINHPTIPLGTIISQSPNPGEKIKITNSVSLVISKGPLLLEVPLLINRELREARILLRDSNLQEGNLSYQSSETIPEDYVISQNPSAGIMVPESTKVDLVISRGRELRDLTMPDFVGMTVEEARASINAMRLEITDVSYEQSTQFEQNRIISQSPQPNTSIKEGDGVTLKVSLGPGPGPARNRNLIITLPSTPDVQVVQIQLRDDLGKREVYNKTHSPQDSPLTIPLTVRGAASIEVYINGEFYDSLSNF